MLNSRVALLFKHLPDKYPHVLERAYRHVLNRMMHLWGTPEFDEYLHDLLIDKRGNRQGFQREALAELLFLGELHEILKRNGYHLPQVGDPWKSVPVKDPSPKGFLHVIERGRLDGIEAFLNAGVTIDYRFEGNQTPLMIAAISGQLDAALCLIENGAGVGLRDRGDYTALHWAALYGRYQMVEVLARVGAKLDSIQNSGDTPLGLAVMRGHVDVARLLLNLGADHRIGGDHGLPLALAQQKNNREMIALLKRQEAYS